MTHVAIRGLLVDGKLELDVLPGVELEVGDQEFDLWPDDLAEMRATLEWAKPYIHHWREWAKPYVGQWQPGVINNTQDVEDLLVRMATPHDYSPSPANSQQCEVCQAAIQNHHLGTGRLPVRPLLQVLSQRAEVALLRREKEAWTAEAQRLSVALSKAEAIIAGVPPQQP